MGVGSPLEQLCLALAAPLPCAWLCQNWALEVQTRPARLKQPGQGFTPWMTSPEQQPPTDPCGTSSVGGKVAVPELQGLQPLGEDLSHASGGFAVARGSRSSSQGSGCSRKQGWLHGPCSKRHKGICGCDSCFPTSCFCSPGLQPDSTPCSPPRDPTPITVHNSPAAAAAPRAPGLAGQVWLLAQVLVAPRSP